MAIGTPCVGVYRLTGLMEAGPFHQSTHRAAMPVRVPYPVCDQGNRKTRCEHDVCFAEDVPPDHVRGVALALLATTV